MTTAETKAPLSQDVEDTIRSVTYHAGDVIADEVRAHIAAFHGEVEKTKLTAAGHYLDWQLKETSLKEQIEALRKANKQLHQHASFYHLWATRTNTTDEERLSVIKHYPLTEDELEALAQPAPDA